MLGKSDVALNHSSHVRHVVASLFKNSIPTMCDPCGIPTVLTFRSIVSFVERFEVFGTIAADEQQCNQ